MEKGTTFTLTDIDEFWKGKKHARKKHMKLCLNFFNRYQRDEGQKCYDEMGEVDFTRELVTTFIMRLCDEPSLAYNTVDKYLSALKMTLCDKFTLMKINFWDLESYYTGLREGVLLKMTR